MYYVLEVSNGIVVGLVIFFFLLGALLGAVLTSIHLKKQIDKNPPISENQIRELYRQTGRNLSEAQVMRIMKNIKNQKG